jgi:hypothetical protein
MNKCDGVGLQIHVAPRMGVVEKEEMYDEVRKKKETKILLFLFFSIPHCMLDPLAARSNYHLLLTF